MIIRQGINVKYSHDEEALVDWLVGLREFAGVSADTVIEWLRPLRDYAYNQDFRTFPDHEQFFRPEECFYVRQSVREQLVTVTLWKAHETAHRLIEDHGFSCLVCGLRTPWAGRPGFYENLELQRLLHCRRTIWAPALVCRGCASDVVPVFRGAPTERWIDDMVRRLASRVHSGRMTPDAARSVQ